MPCASQVAARHWREHRVPVARILDVACAVFREKPPVRVDIDCRTRAGKSVTSSSLSCAVRVSQVASYACNGLIQMFRNRTGLL
jgi:hypothetical protein